MSPVNLLPVLTALLCAPALAGDPPPTPAADFSPLPESARVRPPNRNGEPHQAQVRLVADRTALVPGQTVRLGVHLEPDAGWHSYWRAPGDVGEPLRITWELPPGASATVPRFPLPERFDTEGIVSYGYSGPVLLFSEVALPADLPAGEAVISARTEWLICEDTCIPGEAALALPMPVAASAEPSAFAPLFEHYAALHPVPAIQADGLGVEAALSASAVRPGDRFQVAIRVVGTGEEPLTVATTPGAGTWPAFAPIFDPYTTWVDGAEVKTAADGSAVIVVSAEAYAVDALPEGATIGGLLQVRVGDRPVATEVEVPLPWAAAGSAVEPSASPLWQLAGAAVALPTGEGGGSGEGGAGPSDGAGGAAAEAMTGPGLVRLLLMAFLGGLILNVMPCVLPVISLKLFSLVGSAEKSAGAQRRAGLAFTGGVLASFALLAVGVAVVKASFGSVGWGFQFQSPTYVAALTTIVFAFGLSLFGVFEIPAFGADAAASATDREGLAGSFLFGMFATLLATPCSAPFLGTAVGFAFGQPMPVVFLFLMVIGLGLAAPFLVIAFVPGLFRMLPRPGAWMEVFKQLMGFTLIGTAIWLVDVLAAQVGPDRIVGFLAFLAVIGVGAWVFGRWGGVERTRRDQGLAFAGALAISLVGGWLFLDLDLDESEECDDGALAAAAELSYAEEIPWQRFSGERLAQAAGTPLFIDFTADWCLTCKVNERTVIETEAVRGAMERCGMVALKADWTRRDEEITSWLTRYGKAGVPFYLVVPPTGTDHAIPLPEVITTSSLVSTIEQACG